MRLITFLSFHMLPPLQIGSLAKSPASTTLTTDMAPWNWKLMESQPAPTRILRIRSWKLKKTLLPHVQPFWFLGGKRWQESQPNFCCTNVCCNKVLSTEKCWLAYFTPEQPANISSSAEFPLQRLEALRLLPFVMMTMTRYCTVRF